MLRITVPAREFYDESKEEFVEIGQTTLIMEHSLISISKWEAKWKKPYLSDGNKTTEETLDYLRCMTIHPSKVDPAVYKAFSKENLNAVAEYIQDPMTATTIHSFDHKSGRKEIITSEIIYYWMIAQNIPTEYEKWHLNRLLTLIRVCSIKNNPKQKKMSKAAIARQNHAINAARRKKYNTRG